MRESCSIYSVMMRSRTVILTFVLLALTSAVFLPVLAAQGDAAGWYNSAQNLTEQKNYSAALLAYDQAITLDPQFAEAWDGRADILNRVYADTTTPYATLMLALNSSNQALALNASSATAWINHGLILYNIGYYYSEHNDQANATRYYNEQLDAFNKAIALEPDNTDALFNRGYALCGMGRCTEGLIDFQKVKSLDPSYPYIDGNIESAQKVAAKETPFYVKYAFEIVLGIIAVAGAALWYLAVRKKY